MKPRQQVCRDGDYAIIPALFPVRRNLETLKPFKHAGQRVIRQQYYGASARILFRCKHRFWEEDDGSLGDGLLTDLPIRNLYYPDPGRETGRGRIHASYTWSEDAQRWGSLKHDDRILQAPDDAAEIHLQITHKFEVGTCWMWHDAEFASGAFALFDPGRQTLSL